MLDLQPRDGTPMRSFTAAHTDVQMRMAEKVARYLRMGLSRAEACKLANVSLRWTYYHKDLITRAERDRKAS